MECEDIAKDCFISSLVVLILVWQSGLCNSSNVRTDKHYNRTPNPADFTLNCVITCFMLP
jgi:hypothetical protein